MKRLLFLNVFIFQFLIINFSHAQFTSQDTLRGSNGPGRDWWDVQRYDLRVSVNPDEKSISGDNKIMFTALKGGKDKIMQIDLQNPMQADAIFDEENKRVEFRREGNVFWLDFEKKDFNSNKDYWIQVHFSGNPKVAKRPPWDGGWIFTKDAQGRPWMSVACQGLGASVWYPCKDYQGDEPDKGIRISISIPDSLAVVSNGRGKKSGLETLHTNNNATYEWQVQNPINNYNIIPYIGKYVNWSEKYAGEKGELDCSYWVLDYNLEKAKEQFKQAAMTLKAFEHWFGPYPFYEDGFKLVEAPHLGMEHQSAVAYGNGFKNGYRGRDLSGSGWGLKWDFIIVHEVGHEWFGNNITTIDVADMWVHESFTNYSETLFTEYYFGKEAGNDYCIGTRALIQNDKPIIGPYGVNQEGSGDMYYKGGNMIHTIRQVINDDDKFRQILRGLNKDFYHQVVTTKQVEKYITDKSGINFSKVFDQYLRTVKIPVLEYKISGSSLSFRWSNCVDGFDMRVKLKDGKWLDPSTAWKEIPRSESQQNNIEADRNFYISVKQVK